MLGGVNMDENNDITGVLEDTFFSLRNIGEFTEALLELCFAKNVESLNVTELKNKFMNAHKLTNALYELVSHKTEELEQFVEKI